MLSLATLKKARESSVNPLTLQLVSEAAIELLHAVCRILIQNVAWKPHFIIYRDFYKELLIIKKYQSYYGPYRGLRPGLIAVLPHQELPAASSRLSPGLPRFLNNLYCQESAMTGKKNL